MNAQCEPIAWPMPRIEDITRKLAGSKFFASLDIFKGFWLMPLDADSQELYSFMTDDAVYTPKRSIQGALNSGLQFQSRMQKIFADCVNESTSVKDTAAISV